MEMALKKITFPVDNQEQRDDRQPWGELDRKGPGRPAGRREDIGDHLCPNPDGYPQSGNLVAGLRIGPGRGDRSLPDALGFHRGAG